MTFNPQFPQPTPPWRTGDVVLSVLILVITTVVWAVGAFNGYAAVAFLDTCPEATCDGDGAAAAVALSTSIGGAVLLLGIFLTIVLLVMRVMAWPWTLVIFVVCVATLLVGGVAFKDAVG